jgi:uncharacterized protein YxjI
MQHPLQYPLTLNFEMALFTPALPLQISVRNGTGREILYVRQKLLKLRDKIKIFSDSSQSQELYEVNADRILDWSARFVFTDPQGRTVGAIQRQGSRSIWRATYDIQDASGRDLFGIQEEQPWLKVIGYFVEAIPFVEAFSGYLFSPTYGLQRAATGQTDLRITKRRRAVSLTFRVDNLAGPLPEHEEVATVLGILIMVLHERYRK